MNYMATEAEDIEQNVVILVETDQELRLSQQAEQVEREAQSVLESLPFSSGPFSVENPLDTNATVISETVETPFSTTPSLDLLQSFEETLEPSYDSHNPTALMNRTISSTETYGSPQNTSFLPTVYSESDSHQNLSFTFNQSEFERTAYEHRTQNQHPPDTNNEDNTRPSEKLMQPQEMQKTNFTTDSSKSNDSETNSSHIQESFWETTTVTIDPNLQVQLEEAAVEGSVQVLLTMQTSNEEGTLPPPATQTSKSHIETLTSPWAHTDGSGDISKGMSSFSMPNTNSWFR